MRARPSSSNMAATLWAILRNLARNGLIPIVAPIALGVDCDPYNTIANTAAGTIAGALGATRFFLLTDVPGVLNKADDLQTDLDRAAIEAMKDDGTISG